MAFVVAHGHEDGPQTLWVLFKYDEDRTTIEYTVFEQDSVHWILILIRCYATEDRQSTQAEISPTPTWEQASLPSTETSVICKPCTDLKDWETAINHYLRTGECLSHHH